MAGRVIGFPRTINEKAARTVAGVVAVTGLVALLVPAHWLVIPLAYGFWARVLTGPRLSPLAALASRVIAPRLGAPREVPGPPKRFARAWARRSPPPPSVALPRRRRHRRQRAARRARRGRDAASRSFGYCAGCQVFGLLMRAGLIPEDVCAECADIWARRPA